MQLPRCRECKFFVDGRCHRFPPTDPSKPDQQKDFPVVDPDQRGCGEYQ